jgi:ABC-type glycerol-3-phosphate transport system substrate-binding protein
LGLLREHGYAPEDLPNNLADLIPFAQELTEWAEGDAEPAVTAWPLAGGTTFDFYTALVDNLGGFWWLDDGTSGFGEPEWEEAWRMTLAMFDTYRLDARQGLDAIERFYAGKSYFLPQQLWVGRVLRTDHPDIEWGVMTHPTPNGQAPYGWKEAHTGWGNLSIKTGDALDATWEVWKALYSPEWTRANALNSNYIPGRLEAQNQEPFVAENPQWAGAIVKHEPGNSVCPGFWPADMWDIINTAWEQVYLNNADVAETLQAAKRDADALLAVSPEIQATIITKQDYIDHPQWTNSKIPIASWWDGTHGSYLTAEQQAELG